MQSSKHPPRFHGAFTGGFSAGYHNTVGSEEGFKPKSFVSSRTNRASIKKDIYDIIDEEDGLLGGSFVTKEVSNSIFSFYSHRFQINLSYW